MPKATGTRRAGGRIGRVLLAAITACAGGWGGACRLPDLSPTSSKTPAPSSAAVDELTIRFPRPEGAEREIRGYKLTKRTRLRRSDVETGQLAEFGSSYTRVESTSAPSPTTFKTTVFFELEVEEGSSGIKRVERPRYTVTKSDGKITVSPIEDEEPLDPDHEKVIVERSRGDTALDALIDLLTRQPFERGKRVEVPPRALALLDEARRGSATLVGIEERWQRRVARLELKVERDETSERPQMRGRADLFVEVETGRPIVMHSLLRSTLTMKHQGREIRDHGINVGFRRWGFSRPGDDARSSFSTLPQRSVVGSARQLALSPDERTAAVLMEGVAGTELAVWDIGRRRVIASRASKALFVRFDERFLYEVNSMSVSGYWLLNGQVNPFGGVPLGTDLGYMLLHGQVKPPFGGVPGGTDVGISAAAAGHAWVAVGSADGHVAITEPRYNCIVGAFRTGLSHVDAMALADDDHLAVVDPLGQVEIVKLDSDAQRWQQEPWCARGVRPSTKTRFKLPGPVASADALKSTFLFTTLQGDVVVSPASGPPQPLGRLGGDAALASNESGAVVAVTTRAGTYPLGSKHAPKVDLPRGSELSAIGRSGRLGLRAEGRSVALFEPGRAKDIAKLETSAVPVVGMAARGSSIVALADDGRTAQLLSWDLGEARARAVRLDGADGAGSLTATAAGLRHVVASGARVEVRETGSGSVVRAWKRDELVRGGGAVGAQLDRRGDALAVRGPDGAIGVWDVGAGTLRGELPAGSSAGPRTFAWSPTEDVLFSLRTDGRLVAIELPARRPRFEVEATKFAGDANRIAISADGEWVALSGTHRAESGWNPNIPVVELRSARDGSLIVALSPRWATISALAFSADKQLMFAGTSDGELLTWDTASGQLINEFTAHDRRITSLSAAPSGAFVVSSSTDGTVRLWDPVAFEETLAGPPWGILEDAITPWRPTQLIATLMVDDRGDAVAATGDGYYKADRGSLRSLELVSAGASYDFEQFDAALHRPDIVIDRLGASDPQRLALFRAAREKRAKLLEGQTLQNLPQSPKVSLARPLPVLTQERQLRLPLAIQAQGAELRALHVAVNSVPVGPATGQPLSGSSWTGEIPITLGAGPNRIQIYATDVRRAPSKIESHVVEYVAPAEPPALYVVVVGVSKYADVRLDLNYAAKDARNVAALLATSKRFSRVRVHELLDRQATRQNILAARSFLEQARLDDTVVVFFAGHGLLNDQLDYYFGTTDIQRKTPAKNGLRYDQLSSLVEGLDARRRLVLLDTCHAGEVDKAADAASALAIAATRSTKHVKEFSGLELQQPVAPHQSFGLMQQMFADLRASSGAVIVGSAGGSEFAVESAAYDNGVFTFALLEALKQSRGDSDRDGVVTATELVRYVRGRVEELTGGAQRPVTRGENLDLDFPLY